MLFFRCQYLTPFQMYLSLPATHKDKIKTRAMLPPCEEQFNQQENLFITYSSAALKYF